MNEALSRLTALSPQKLALYAASLQRRVNELQEAAHEPIAIIGAACRVPGASSPEQLWRLLLDKRDATTEIPPTRWDVDTYYAPGRGVPGKMYVRRGGFLPGIDGFDAAFFGISPREAQSMDPQQRLLLEVAWECLENAGVAPDEIADRRVGVFVGVSPPDYTRLFVGPGTDLASLDPHFASGNAPSVAAGRLSYTLALRGPCVALDTACSSSLVATHLAVQSLRAGEAEMALAGGVNLILTPAGHVALSQVGMLSPDGACKSFDSRADGFVRSEGCGLVLLKRLSAALRDGDPILAVIRGSAVNQDGRSTSLTAPNGPSQELVIAAALADARARPDEVGFVEAHGTGTALGDPIEAIALAGALGHGHDKNRPLLIGALKSNLGHMEAAAGIGSLIKLALSLKAGKIPPNIHFDRASPHIPWAELPLSVSTEAQQWPEGRPLGGVSSFGFSGTNAHLVLGPPPIAEKSAGRIAPVDRPRQLLVLSARSATALENIASRYADQLEHQQANSLADFAHEAAVSRAALPYRAAIITDNRGEAIAALRKLGEESSSATSGNVIRRAVAPAALPKIAFLFTGQGAQYKAMGRSLFASEPGFREILNHANEILREEAGWSFSRSPLTDLLYGPDPAGCDLDSTQYAQPALFAVGYALADLWQRWGLKPEAVMGHSLGEYTAACVAGAFDFDAGLRLVAARGRLMQSLRSAGAMHLVRGPISVVETAVAAHSREVAIAAFNSPTQHVISGARGVVEEIAEKLQRVGCQTRPLQVSQAFHSPLLDQLVPDFARLFSGLTLRPARLPLISNITADWANRTELTDAAYWVRHMRAPVRFGDGVSRLRAAGFELLIEVGPQPHLLPIVREVLPDESVRCVSSLRHGRDDWNELLESTRSCWLAGAKVDWRGFDRPYARSRVALPTYPFEHRSYWLPTSSSTATPGSGHAFLSERRDSPHCAAQFRSRLTSTRPSFIADHRVAGSAAVPAAAILEAALSVARAVEPGKPFAVEDLVLQRLLVVPDDDGLVVESTVDEPDGNSARGFHVFSRAVTDAGPKWTLSAEARLVPVICETKDEVDLAAASARCTSAVDVDSFYADIAVRGVELGTSFRLIERAKVGNREAVATLRVPDGQSDSDYILHPCLIDAALQLFGIAEGAHPGGLASLPFVIGRFVVFGLPQGAVRAVARIRGGEGADAIGEVTLFSEADTAIAHMEGVRFRPIAQGSIVPRDWFFDLRQERVDPPTPASVDLIRESTDPVVAANCDAEPLARYVRFIYDVETLARSYAAKAVAERLSAVTASGRRLLARLEGIADNAETDVPRLRERFAADYPDCKVELDMLDRCGSNIAAVVAGDADPLQLLFPDGSSAAATRLYRDSPLAAGVSAVVAAAVNSLVRHRSPGRPLRILEVGAGTGGTTARLLGSLPADRVRYVFSDVSAGFVAAARSTFGAYDFVDYRKFDVERDGVEQGLPAGGFDVVIAANVLHATASLRETLANVRTLLAPGGALLLVESTERRVAADITFGLTEGWWRFADRDIRPDYPLLAADAWKRLLLSSGFAEAESLTEIDGRQVFADQAVLLATEATRPISGRWLVLSGEQEAAEMVSAALEARGATVDRHDTGEGLAWATRGDISGIVDLRLLDLARPGIEASHVGTDKGAAWSNFLTLTRSLLLHGLRGIRLITAVPAGDDSLAALMASVLQGMHRVIRREHPEIEARLVGLTDLVPAEIARLLVREIESEDRELETTWSDGHRWTPRLQFRRDIASLSRTAPRRYAIEHNGSFDGLTWLALERRTPAAGEVEIEVEATALNFRDVLNVLGLYPGELGPPGEECAGRIARVGDGVTGFAPGDPVVAIASGSLASFVTTSATFVRARPQTQDAASAATVPIAYLTAAVALEQVGQVKPAQRILIHAAAGGVGLAAVHIARAAGAEIIATASRGKWQTLRALGIQHIFDSRTTEFTAEIGLLTNGKGVDLVLNSLAGEFIEASVGALKIGGTFLEIGRRDIWSKERMARTRPDVVYHPIVVAEEAMRDPRSMGKVFDDLLARVDRGVLPVLPHQIVPFEEAPAALRRMAQGQHVGKLVVQISGSHDSKASEIRSDGTYLVTGAFGGIGFGVVEWLVASGARSLVLIGRRAPEAEVVGGIERLCAQGAAIRIEVCDVASEAAMTRVFESLSSMPQLRGIFHAAGTLADAALVRQDEARFRQVLAPKVDGGWLLHRLSLGMSLDHFVSFGAGTALFGTPGQANHAAANSYLAQLARYRRANGLPGLCIDWGPWAKVGAAARLKGERVARQQGMGMIEPRQGMAAMAALMAAGTTHAAVLPVDWRTYLANVAVEDVPPLMAGMIESVRSTKSEAPASPARSMNAASPLNGANLGEFVRAELRRLLGLAADQTIDPDRPLQEYGVDSLLAVELRNLLSRRIGRGLPATLLFDFPTLSKLVRHLEGTSDASSVRPAPTAPAVPAIDGVAIIGLGCRFPGGAHDAESFWRLLDEGRDCVGPIPQGRWQHLQGRLSALTERERQAVTQGGFVDQIDMFDARAFGISPSEARQMDPQQRLFLETTWEALDHAGLPLKDLSGVRGGVFVGIAGSEYSHLLLQASGDGAEGLHLATGNSASVAAGRVAYLLGLTGPAMAVDTACSSSLVAVHLACRSLMSGECDVAVAGGVNVIVGPELAISFARSGALSMDGRSKAFSARADGYGRGEGAGTVILKRLADALRDGDRVLAVVRGSAVNQDGRSAGLTAPSGAAQEAVIRTAIAAAGIGPEAVDYVETHGTGTLLGDPIEANALGAALRPEGTDAPALLIGSVKSNLGHLETAAGVAGLIKAVLVLHKGCVPRSLHAEDLNPHIPWSRLSLRLAQRSCPLRRGAHVGVSSFGFSGTNVHLVLAPPTEHLASDVLNPESRAYLLPVSARSLPALAETVVSWANFLERTEEGVGDIVHTAAVRRTHHEYRLVVSGRSRQDFARALRSWSTEGASESAASGHAHSERLPRVAFVFSGLGGQWPGMALDMIKELPAFRDAWSICAAAMLDFLPAPATELLEQLRNDDSLEDMCTVPLLQFGVQVALAAQWKAWGVQPHALVGHSMGEIAAAHVAGALTLKDAVFVMAKRSRALAALEGLGGVLAVESSEEEIQQDLVELKESVSLAAVNGRRSIVLSGEVPALEIVAGRLRDRNVFHRWARIAVPAHSPLLDPQLPGFLDELALVSPGIARDRIYSTTLGKWMDGTAFDAPYWVRNLRDPVRFAGAIDALGADGCNFFIEISPHPILSTAIEAQLQHSGVLGRVMPSLRRDCDGPADMLLAFGALHAAGFSLDWQLLSYDRGKLVDLPMYPWQRESYWPRLKEAPSSISTKSDDITYAIDWQPMLQVERRDATGGWLVLADRGGVAASLARRLEGLGGQVRILSSEPDLPYDKTTWRAVIDLRPLDDSSEGSLSAPIVRIASLLQGLQMAQVRSSLWVVTAGGQAVGAMPLQRNMAPTLGFGVVASLEFPELWGGSCDLDPAEDSEAKADHLLHILLTAGNEDQVACRGGRNFVPRLVPVPARSASLAPLDASASYLITGGLGGIGLELAAWLVRRGAQRLLLVGRTPPDAARRLRVEALRQGGVTVDVEALDVASPGAMAGLIARAARAGTPVKGIIHAAGVTLPRRIVDLDDAVIDQVMTPKVAGALALHEASRDTTLDFFVMLSSGAAQWGGEGQAHYAAANRFLDALAAERVQLGYPATAVDLGWWENSGMMTEAAARYYETIGVLPVTAAEACAAIERAISTKTASTVVARFHWDKFRAVMEARRRRPLFDALSGVEAGTAGQEDLSQPPILDQLDRASSAERRRMLIDLVASHVATVMGFTDFGIADHTTGLFQLGLDSVMAVRLRGRLERALGRRLPTTIAFEHPTVVELAAFLDGGLGSNERDVVPSRSEAEDVVATLVDEIDQLSDEDIERRLANRSSSL